MFSVDPADKDTEVDQPKSVVSRIVSRFSVSPAKEEPPPPRPPSADSQPQTSRKKCIIIAVLAVVLLLLLLVIVGVFVYLESGPEKTEAPIANSSEITLAEEIKKLMNTSVDPCDNFYKYACGGWATQDEASKVKGEKSFLSNMNETTKKQLIDILERPAKEGDLLYKLRTKKFFTDCSNMEKLKEYGTTPFFELLKSIGKFPLLESKWQDTDLNLQQLITQLTLLGIEPLFKLSQETSTNDPSIFGIVLRIPSKFAPYDNNEKEWARNTFKLLGADIQNPEIVNEIEEIFQVQVEAYNVNFETSVIFEPRSVEFIEKHINWENFSWLKFFKDISGDVSLNNDSMIVVENHNYIHILYRDLMKGFSKRAVVDYLMLDLLEYTFFLDDRFKQRPKPNKKQDDEWNMDRENKCLELVRTIFKDEVSQIYANEVYNTSLTLYVKDILVDLKDAYRLSIEAAKWLSYGVSQINTVNHLKAMKEKIGEIRNSRDEKMMNNFFEKVVFNSFFEFFPAFVREVKTYTYSTYASKNKEEKVPPFIINTSDLPSSITVGMQYQSTTNSLFVPAAFLQYPVINLKWPRSMNYGALGSLLGHELMHAFLAGFNSTWSTEEAYNFKRHCVLSIYSGFSVGEFKVNEILWLTENLCDYVGLSQSFKAYQLYRKRKGEEDKVPGLDLNHNQLFFLSFTQMYCQIISKDSMENALNQTHAPYYFRASGSLMTSKEFIETYGCSNGTNMDRKRKCDFFGNENIPHN